MIIDGVITSIDPVEFEEEELLSRMKIIRDKFPEGRLNKISLVREKNGKTTTDCEIIGDEEIFRVKIV